jgi:fatty acid desaturase
MSVTEKWNPESDWKKAEIKWDKIEISKEDFKRFTKRSDAKGLAQCIGFLLIFVVTGGVAWWAMSRQLWVLMAFALYLHGSFHGYFGSAQHELGHGTVFKSKALGSFFNVLFSFLNWTWNPALYRISHNNYHHRYTLHQNSDGEETPTYIELTEIEVR